MSSLSHRDVYHRAASQFGLISRAQALEKGMTAGQIARASTSGAWVTVHPGVYRLAGSPVSPESDLLAACLAGGGAVASHQSAAWLWRLLSRPPDRPTVSVGRSARFRRPGIVIHRLRDLDVQLCSTWRGIPCTNPLRTLVDLAGVIAQHHLDDAVDRALATRLVTVEGITAEIDRLSQHGRRGVNVLRQALSSRGYSEGPSASVLESRTLRLLAGGGFRPVGIEVSVDDGRYRLDVVLSARVAMEVDGYAYHASPEAMGRDLRRRRDLARLGWTV
ncbi:MAG: type IV toxin-antitoxin system AbiEi family antitoxin, partial [Actinomycetota bacterium]|nr:type IV toxin-antitoxin system AbiEi family antitoxin [Actinomycetota bacterium]